MIIHKLHTKNFKSIADHYFDFDQIHGFWEISGVVGSGKTSIGEALLFALFGTVKQKNNIDLISWGEKKCIVEIWFESKGFNIYIKRTINHIGQCPIEVTINGEPLTFSNKRNAQIILESDYYDVSRLALESLCIISFDGFQSFSRMNTQDTKRFLDQVFGFQILSAYTDECKNELKSLATILNKCENKQDSIQQQIKKFNEWKEEASTEMITQELLNSMHNKILEDQAAINEFASKILTESRRLLSEPADKKQRMAEVVALGKQKKKDIEFLNKGVCPVCGATLDQSHLAIYEQERDALLKEYNELRKQIDETEKLNKESINKMEEEKKNLNDALFSNIKKYNEFQQKYNKQKDCNIQIDSLNDELSDLAKKIKKINKDIDEYNQLIDVIGTDIKREALNLLIPHINENIKYYINILHQPYLIEFDNNFKCNIRFGALKDAVPVSSLSTGQQKIVDMVVILAILKVLLSGVNFSIIMLDELFANLDEDMRNEMCRMLKSSIKDNQTMFVVSHAPLNAQYIDGYIKTRVISGRTQFELMKS